MTLVSIQSFLPKAFERIDRKNILKGYQDAENIQKTLSSIFKTKLIYKVTVKNKTLIISSTSSVLKHLLYTHRERILQELQIKAPEIEIKEISFKGI